MVEAEVSPHHLIRASKLDLQTTKSVRFSNIAA